ncbi:IS110 family RNA-guided transposase [Arabiibacter massiliensis]|uniref:IS110 family transposase n=1 Tax=Arabiibacter massiliensis TaxID=1870985 RepID=UPI0009BB288D|nr:IS110 family transposase [Arabiibacter massiliensis]
MDARDMDYEVFCGIDVGKSGHFAVSFRRDSLEPEMRRAIAADEADIRRALADASGGSRMLVVVDQPGGFGELPVAVARDMGFDAAFISPKDFHDLAVLYSEGKSDAADALVIADAPRRHPRLVRLVAEREEALSGLRVLPRARADAVRERTRAYNRLHDCLERVCPPLEELFAGDALHTSLARAVIARYGGPAGLRRAGEKRAAQWASKLKGQANRGPEKIREAFEAIGRMGVALPAAGAVEAQAKRLAARLDQLEEEVAAAEREIARIADSLPEIALLQSMPGIGPVYASVIVAEIGGIGRFADGNRLASYAGIAPVKDQSGKRDSSKKSKKGNRRLKAAFLGSADAALDCDGASRAYYDRKRAEGKLHRQALRALARRRADVIYAILSSGRPYRQPAPAA